MSNTTQGAGMDKQIETKMIENTTGSLAVCLDKDSKFNGWMFSKHPDGKWVTKRLALPMEIKQAQDVLRLNRHLNRYLNNRRAHEHITLIS